MPPFEIPESVTAYFQEPPTRSVVDALVSTLDDPKLLDMDRGKLSSLSEGVLLACQIRADFVAFMAGLWANTFGVALEKSDLTEFFPEDCTIKAVWTNKWFWSHITRGPDLERPYFALTVQIDERSHEVMLLVHRFDENYDLREFRRNLQLPDGWRRSADEDGPLLATKVGVTMGDLIANSDKGLAKLSDAASGVIELIGRLLR